LGVGVELGVGLGAVLGLELGVGLGAGLGLELGVGLGAGLGLELGVGLGAVLGVDVGCEEGIEVGSELGRLVGAATEVAVIPFVVDKLSEPPEKSQPETINDKISTRYLVEIVTNPPKPK
jgi:hypothetical protein